jgi:hypothetical protein
MKNFYQDYKWFWLSESNLLSSDFETSIQQYNNSDFDGVWVSLGNKFEGINRVDLQNYKVDISFLSKLLIVKSFKFSSINAELKYVECLNPIDLEALHLWFAPKSIIGIKKEINSDFSFIKKFENLEELAIQAEGKSTFSVSNTKFEKMHTLCLYFPNLGQIDFACFPNLEILTLRNGIESAELLLLERLTKLRSISIGYLKKTANLDFLSNLTELEDIDLTGLPLVEQLPDMSKLTKLNRVRLESIKNLKDVTSLLDLSNLEYIDIDRMSNKFDIEVFRPLTQSKSLKQIRYLYEYQPKSEVAKLIEMFGNRFSQIY